MLKNAAALIPTWFKSWGLPSSTPVDVAVNNRLRRARGRAVLREGRIEVRPDLLSGSRRNLLETLCHEAAHIAVFHKYPNARPHGPEWRQLVRASWFRAPRAANRRVSAPTKQTAMSERAVSIGN